MVKTYKGIEFEKGYSRSFSDFKQEFESAKYFRDLPPKQRSKELKEAYKIATSKKTSI